MLPFSSRQTSAGSGLNNWLWSLFQLSFWHLVPTSLSPKRVYIIIYFCTPCFTFLNLNYIWVVFLVTTDGARDQFYAELIYSMYNLELPYILEGTHSPVVVVWQITLSSWHALTTRWLPGWFPAEKRLCLQQMSGSLYLELSGRVPQGWPLQSGLSPVRLDFLGYMQQPVRVAYL